MINYKTCTAEIELISILDLQRKNLPMALSKEEVNSQGFVTVTHSYKDLKKLNDIEKHIIAKDGESVVAYLLAMTQISRLDIPVLTPMFEIFDNLAFSGKAVSQFKYLVIGQVCVDKNYRSQGILDSCYAFYKDCYKHKYDFAITEISTTNLRSLNAHKRIGFKEIHHYVAPGEKEWSIVLWDWNSIGCNSD